MKFNPKIATQTRGGKSKRLEALLYGAVLAPAILLAVQGERAVAGPVTASEFQTYTPANAASIQAGPLSLYTVQVNSLAPTQMNEGLAEVGKKAAGFDLLTPSQLQANLLTDVEPVVIGPGGKLYLTDGHHTFTALLDSIYGASNPTVYVNVIANYSTLTTAQFFATMQANNFLLPLNDGVPQTVNTATGAPIPTTLTGLTSDPYRGLEYSILKNKSSKLFTTSSNITGAVGASIPGLDKMTGFYSDFLEAAAYRNANGGKGLAYLSPGDIALATQWNLNGANTTTLPNVTGTVTVAQLPGFILSQNIVNSGGISNATLAGGALDGNGTFTGVTTLNAGTLAQPITIGTPNVGFVMELGKDAGHTVTLNGTNTYTGGTSILAGDLIVQSDAALGAAVPGGATIDPNNVRASVQAANGIIFNSLTEGNGALTFGTTTGGTFTTSRPIAVGGEVATLDVNQNTVTLSGALVSLGVNGVGVGNAAGLSDLTIDDLTGASTGKLILSQASPYFYGNIIIGNIGKPTVEVMNDAALGATTGPAGLIGQIVLNGGTFQAGASFSSVRGLSVQSKSTFDTNSFTTSFAGALSDNQRNLTITNTGVGAGAVTFGSFQIGSALELTVSKGTGTATSVTFTNGIQQTSTSDQLLLKPNSGTLGTVEKVLSGVAPTQANGIVAPWLVIDSGAANNPYDFATYGVNGYTAFSAYGASLATATAASVVKQAANVTLAANAQAYALNIQKGIAVTATGYTVTLGDGTNAGLILNGGSGSGLTGGTLAFGTAKAFITLNGSSTISSTITGSGGLNLAGTGTLTLSSPSTESGLVTVNSGSLVLSAANVFSTDAQGLLLQDTKNLALANLTIGANNQFAALNSAGNNSTITITGGSILTIGDSNNLSSTISSAITDTTLTTGAITKNGSGLLDLSGAKGIALAAGSSIVANGGALRVAVGAFTTPAPNFVLANGADLQFAQNGGGQYAGAISGAGTLHLIGGTLQLTGTSNTYTGGTIVETGSILDITTANLPTANPNITDAGGLIVFDQTTNGTYAGVISNGAEMGTGPVLQGSLDKDDSTGANSGNVTLTTAQTYTGATTIEAGTLTLAAVDTLATSSGVDLGRIGGGSTATLALAANNTLQALTSEAADTTYVTLGSYTLTLNTASTTKANFGGAISGTGAVVKTGLGTEVFSGANTYSGGTTVQNGELQITGSINSTGATTVTGGLLDVANAGALVTSSTTVNGGALELDTGSTFNSSTVTVGANGTVNPLGGAVTITTFNNNGTVNQAGGTGAITTFNNNGTVNATGGAPTITTFNNYETFNEAGGGGAIATFNNTGTVNASSGAPTITTFNNSGVLNLQNNGTANHAFTVGTYNGAAGGTVQIGVNFAARTADNLIVTSATGTSKIVVVNTAPNTPIPYNPTGIVVVTSTNPMTPSTFTLAGGPVQEGFFQYDLAYTPDPHFLLVSTPTADAFRVAAVPTAAQSIWQDTAGVWLDRQSDLRDLIAGGDTPAPKGDTRSEMGVWGRALGGWTDRTQTSTYSLLNKTYAYQTGYNQSTGAVFVGVDGGKHGLIGGEDTLLIGLTAGYINSTQSFKGSTTSANYEGGSVGVSATYLNKNLFLDALVKADLLKLNYSDPALANVGASQEDVNLVNFGAVVDTGYRFGVGRGFIEPLAMLSYVSTRVGGLSLAGSQVGFGDNSLLKARVGLRAGSTLFENKSIRIENAVTASYWARLTGGSNATIDSGSGAPLFGASDPRARNYGEAGLGVNVFSKTSGWSGFFKGDYQFASGYDAGTIKGGVRLTF